MQYPQVSNIQRKPFHRRSAHGLIAALLYAAGLLVQAPVFAQDQAKERERRLLEQVRRSQSAQQQLTREKAELEKSRDDLDAKVKQAESSGKAAQSRAGTLKRELDDTAAKLAAERSNVERLKAELGAANESAQLAQKAAEAKIEQMTAVNGELSKRIALRDTQVRNLQTVGDERAAQLAECSTRADGLYRTGIDLVEQLRTRSNDQADSFFQIGRVSGFETAQKWRDRLEEQRSGPIAPAKP
jgi:chromosome segregation ATPase